MLPDIILQLCLWILLFLDYNYPLPISDLISILVAQGDISKLHVILTFRTRQSQPFPLCAHSTLPKITPLCLE